MSNSVSSNSSNVVSVYSSVMGMRVVHTPSKDDDRLCMVNFSFNDKSVVIKNVRVTALLMWKFNNDDSYEFKRDYSCLTNDVQWKSMPFQLIKYGNVEDSNFMLDCVNVKKSLRVENVMPDGSVAISYVNRYYKAKDYLRYRDFSIKG